MMTEQATIVRILGAHRALVQFESGRKMPVWCPESMTPEAGQTVSVNAFSREIVEPEESAE